MTTHAAFALLNELVVYKCSGLRYLIVLEVTRRYECLQWIRITVCY